MVKVTYKGETRNIPDRYLSGLKGKERTEFETNFKKKPFLKEKKDLKLLLEKENQVQL